MMKKSATWGVRIICIVLLCFAISLIVYVHQTSVKTTLMGEYNLITNEEYKINDTLSFYPVKYEDKNTHMLGYSVDENIEIQEPEGNIKSIIVGKECISITASVFNFEGRLTKDRLSSFLTALSGTLSSENVSEVLSNLDAEQPYIISQNKDTLFIDYITGTDNKNVVVFYRIIVKDARSVTPDLTEKEYQVLSSYLTDLKEVLKINEDLVIPFVLE